MTTTSIPFSRAKAGNGTGRVSLRDTAYEALKHSIITCQLKPGEVVSASVLSEALGIGKTPVNQAIDRLMSDGLVEVMPRKGIVVRPIHLGEIRDIVAVRLLNETQAVRWTAERASISEIKKMEENLDASWKAVKDRDTEALMKLDSAFHQFISAGAQNKILAELLQNLQDRSARFWFLSLQTPDHNKRVCEQHGAIFDGIRDGNPDAAEKAIQEHIKAFYDNVINQL